MRLIVSLALHDLRRDWIYLLCNIALLAGVIVPLLVLFGVRNGVYDALLGRLLSNPATLQIDTRGNGSFSENDALEVAGWDEAGFVTLKTRGLFDLINVRKVDGRTMREAVLSPSGQGDPMLPIAALGPDDVAVSTGLATTLGIEVGDRINLVTQAPERPRQLVLEKTVAGIVAPEHISGRTVLADIVVLDLVEAFYDEYALLDYGITSGRPLDQRVADFEGLRAFATHLETLAPLQRRIEERFGVATQAQTGQVESVLGLGRNLGLALLLTASVAAVGLAAALVSSFWAEIARKRHVLATMALMGVPPSRISLFPIIQALVTAGLGLAVSFGLFALAAHAAERLFDTGLAEEGGLVVIGVDQAAIIVGSVLAFVILASFAGAYRALRTDPAIVLREGA